MKPNPFNSVFWCKKNQRMIFPPNILRQKTTVIFPFFILTFNFKAACFMAQMTFSCIVFSPCLAETWWIYYISFGIMPEGSVVLWPLTSLWFSCEIFRHRSDRGGLRSSWVLCFWLLNQLLWFLGFKLLSFIISPHWNLKFMSRKWSPSVYTYVSRVFHGTGGWHLPEAHFKL